jgi:hypothetical protein
VSLTVRLTQAVAPLLKSHVVNISPLFMLLIQITYQSTEPMLLELVFTDLSINKKRSRY